MSFAFDNTYARDLAGFYAESAADPAPAPELLTYNRDLACALGLPEDPWPEAVLVFSGTALPDGARPLAQAYAGHQFGGFSPQLGDGRALLLGEMIDRKGQRCDIQLKGSGRTPFSRGGDGKAALGPVLREYLMGEAMHALGVPTTRALAAVTTGATIERNGPLPGAVLTRVAASHIRVGTFQFFAARGEGDRLRQLLAYTITRHDPDLASDDAMGLLRRVARRQTDLVAHWMALGFVHGVMNTDNTTLSGETIDYGPCAFMETYDPSTVFSSIDHAGRYAYGNQPGIVRWNCARLAEALLPLIDDTTDLAIERATEVIDEMPALYDAAFLSLFRAKLGLIGSDAGDGALIDDFLAELKRLKLDFTSAFANLTSQQGPKGLSPDWHAAWVRRAGGTPAEIQARLSRANPVVIPRNHLVEEALSAATQGDLAPFNALLAAVTQPFKRPADDRFANQAPADFGPYRTFCGT